MTAQFMLPIVGLLLLGVGATVFFRFMGENLKKVALGAILAVIGFAFVLAGL